MGEEVEDVFDGDLGRKLGRPPPPTLLLPLFVDVITRKESRLSDLLAAAVDVVVIELVC